jgi:predicted DNA-binding protein YlxM (UPF0122 family)
MISKNQRKALQLLFENELTDEEIATECNISRKTLYVWKNNPDFINELRDLSMRGIKNEVPELVKNLKTLALGARSEMVRFQATKDLLDRANITEFENKVEVKGNVAVKVKNPFEGKSAAEMLDLAKMIFKDDG